MKTNFAKIAIFLITLSLFVPSICVLRADKITDGISFVHNIEGATLKTSYSSNYGNGTWRITDNKDLLITLEVLSQDEGNVLMVEHMHVDCLIEAWRAEIDGLPQDVMDDKMHVGMQEGFFISEQYRYEEIFSIEGYGETLINGWMWVCNNFGWGTIEEKRLTEERLLHLDCQGNEFYIVYDIIIKNEGEQYFHKVTFRDNFIVYLDGGFEGESWEKIYIQIYPYRDFAPVLFYSAIAVTIISVALWFYQASMQYSNKSKDMIWKLSVVTFIAACCLWVALLFVSFYYYEILKIL